MLVGEKMSSLLSVTSRGPENVTSKYGKTEKNGPVRGPKHAV
jgi:hypothetical protein